MYISCVYFRVILKSVSDVFLRFGKRMAMISSYIVSDIFYLSYPWATPITHMLDLLTGFHMPQVLFQAYTVVGRISSLWL